MRTAALTGLLVVACVTAVPAQAQNDAATFKIAAAKGDSTAMLRLGFLYEEGRGGVRQDYAQAAIWYRKAADTGLPDAMFFLGVLHWSGRGVRQDYVEAYKWFDLAASRSSGGQQRRFVETRDSLARVMSPDLIAEAEQRERAWQAAVEKSQKSRVRSQK